MNLDEKLAKWTLENAAAMPACGIHRDWTDTPFIEVVPGYLVYNEDVQDIEKMASLRARASGSPREALTDVDKVVEHFAASGWATYLADYAIVARMSATLPPVLDASWTVRNIVSKPSPYKTTMAQR